jgi:uncharacterized membrane-anchored protein YitT (DUF2179 family)
MKKFFGSFPVGDYTTKLSVSIVYAILASVAMNFFYQPGNIYSSGITGLAQILTTLSTKLVGFKIPVSITLYLLNVPLFFVAWLKIGKKFTVFTFLTVTLTSIFMQIVPQTVLSNDPIICAIFGGAVMGSGIGFALKNGLSSGGLDIFSITIRKKTGRSVGSISMYFNGLIIFVAGYLFGWQYMFYSALSIFVSGKVTDAVYTKQKKMQVMIITKNPEAVIDGIQNKMRRGITIIHEAEGAYRHDKQTLLLTVVTRFELPALEAAMKEADPSAFVSISDNVKILGRFYEEEL